ncbi:hypothetical protein FRC06_003361 [Ceratobasidium sp. 370]|nr:hypothetical protein FRC06_003361 [Ceratobasidium sp. 370]
MAEPAAPTPNICKAERVKRDPTPAYHAGVGHGKHFSRTFDCNIDHHGMLDFALEMWTRIDDGVAEPDDGNADFTRAAIVQIEKIFNSDKHQPGTPKFLKDMLRDRATGPAFHNDYGDGLGDGATQGRSDDLSQLKTLPAMFPGRFPTVLRGWSNPTCEELLITPTIKQKFDDEGDEGAELYHQLCSRKTNAQPNEFYQGLFLNSTFSSNPENLYLGFLCGDMYIASLKIIFTGASSATGGPGSKHRSKSAINKMTSLTIPALAYIAMLLRFVLANPGCNWYTIPEDSDAPDYCYNYLTLYYQVIGYLEAVDFKPKVDEILQELNCKVFPNAHRRAQTINLPGSGSNSMMGTLAAACRARQEGQVRRNQGGGGATEG